MQLTAQQLMEARTTFNRLNLKRKTDTWSLFENELLLSAAERLIGVYSQFVDLGDLSDEDLEGLE